MTVYQPSADLHLSNRTSFLVAVIGSVLAFTVVPLTILCLALIRAR